MAEEVVREIFWTDSAKKSFNKIIEYLDTNWTEREISRFVNETVYLLSNLKSQPEIGRPSSKRKSVRICVVNRHTQLIYHYQPRKNRL